MYYVIYVGAGKEALAENYIKSRISEELCERCFHPIRHLRKKIRGEWKEIYQKLIPGYIFIFSENVLSLYEELQKIPLFFGLLGKDDPENTSQIYPLTDAEVKWLMKITGNFKEVSDFDGNPVSELSLIDFDENDQVRVLSGPLTDFVGKVKKIDLHRRIAMVEVDFMGQSTILHLGIEFVQKEE
ncbi:MAG: hypothetical protein E7294_04750 [Lachnospiraceae bacterium]|jgi:transcriptional antiterminator NusG|nr:hypothetical protein [Lachnospiraceae bacterium]